MPNTVIELCDDERADIFLTRLWDVTVPQKVAGARTRDIGIHVETLSAMSRHNKVSRHLCIFSGES